MTAEPLGRSPDGEPSETHEVDAARRAAARAAQLIHHVPAFAALPAAERDQILSDLGTVVSALGVPEPSSPDPYAFAMATPADRRRNPLPGFGGGAGPAGAQEPAGEEPRTAPPRPPATEAIAGRAGALLDEIDFPSFVAGLVHGTFDAVVDASIRQLEAFADLVSSVAKTADQFASQNVSDNQARDWLVERFPADIRLSMSADGATPPRVVPRPASDGEAREPAWLAEFGLADEELTSELIEEQLVPEARRRLANDRLQTLSTMVLLGMNRVVVSDGSITAKLKFRAAARDRAEVDFAVSQDPGGGTWGTRGNATYSSHATMVSTIGVNAQSDAQLRADLFGEVRLNFASETLPLEQFADAAQRSLLQRNARWSSEPVTPAQPATAQPTNPIAPAFVPAPPVEPQQPAATTPVQPQQPAAPAATPVAGGAT